jgi:hypothetical protein
MIHGGRSSLKATAISTMASRPDRIWTRAIIAGAYPRPGFPAPGNSPLPLMEISPLVMPRVQCSGDGPSIIIKPLSNRRRFGAGSSGPLRDCQTLPLMLKVAAAAPVVGLGGSRVPTTVGRGVGAAVVYPLQCHARRALSHVSGKAGEVGPLLTNPDAAAAIVGKGRVAGFLATGSHIAPDEVARVSFAGAMRSGARNKRLGTVATTGPNLPGAKVPAINFFFYSAVAATQPSKDARSKRWNFSDRNQTSKSLPRYVNFLAHGRRMTSKLDGD